MITLFFAAFEFMHVGKIAELTHINTKCDCGRQDLCSIPFIWLIVCFTVMLFLKIIDK